jgi:hypothetical protein
VLEPIPGATLAEPDEDLPAAESDLTR